MELGAGLHTDGLEIYPEQRSSAVCKGRVGNSSSEGQKSLESRGVLGCSRMEQTPSYMECDIGLWSLREKTGRRYQVASWSPSQGDGACLTGQPTNCREPPPGCPSPLPSPTHRLPSALFCRVTAALQLCELEDRLLSLSFLLICCFCFSL